MALQLTDLDFGSDSVGPSPLRIHPAPHGGCISRKFAGVSAAITLPVGTPVSWNAALDMFQAWDPNTGLPADVNEVQEINMDAGADGGTFTLSFEGETTAPIAFGANAATIETAFEGLASVGAGNGTISGGAMPGTPVLITFTGALAGAPQELVSINPSALTDGGLFNVGATVTRITPGNTGGAADEVVTFTVTGTPTGGTFTITYDGETTDPIAYNASAATVLAAVLALDNVPAGAFTASGGALPGTPVVLTAAGAFDDSDLAEFFADGAGFTGGTAPAIAVTTVQGTSSEGDSAPAGDIFGFIFPNEAILSEDGETFHTVMSKGTIHHDDIPLPVTGTPTQSQLDEALRDGLVAKGLIIQHLADAH